MNFVQLLPYDNEVKHFDGLMEFDINFHPTYPFDEDVADQFMRTRCPSWCDRVLFNPLAKSKISNVSSLTTTDYLIREKERKLRILITLIKSRTLSPSTI
jgi:hypothetical protein